MGTGDIWSKEGSGVHGIDSGAGGVGGRVVLSVLSGFASGSRKFLLRSLEVLFKASIFLAESFSFCCHTRSKWVT